MDFTIISFNAIIPFHTVIPFDNFWIHDRFLDSRWIPGFMMDFWVHDGFVDSRWIPGFTVDSWIHNGFLDPRWIFEGFEGFLKAVCFSRKMAPIFLEAPHV